MISNLDSMRIFHNEAVTDEEYMRDCYSDFDLTDNDGWLSLVSKPFFAFGKELMSRIRTEINIDRATGERSNRDCHQSNKNSGFFCIPQLEVFGRCRCIFTETFNKDESAAKDHQKGFSCAG